MCGGPLRSEWNYCVTTARRFRLRRPSSLPKSSKASNYSVTRTASQPVWKWNIPPVHFLDAATQRGTAAKKALRDGEKSINRIECRAGDLDHSHRVDRGSRARVSQVDANGKCVKRKSVTAATATTTRRSAPSKVNFVNETTTASSRSIKATPPPFSGCARSE